MKHITIDHLPTKLSSFILSTIGYLSLLLLMLSNTSASNLHQRNLNALQKDLYYNLPSTNYDNSTWYTKFSWSKQEILLTTQKGGSLIQKDVYYQTRSAWTKYHGSKELKENMEQYNNLYNNYNRTTKTPNFKAQQQPNTTHSSSSLKCKVVATVTFVGLSYLLYRQISKNK